MDDLLLEELLAVKRTNPETGREEYDYDRMKERIEEHRVQLREDNLAAIAAQNKEGESMSVYARPVASAAGNEYDAYAHAECGPHETWDKLLINDTIRNKKCMGCGYSLGRQE